MAKKEDPKPSKSGMTFIMFHLDASDDTLQQSFRTLGQALENSFRRAKALPPKTVQPSLGGGEEREIEAEVVEEENDSGGDNGQQTSTPTSRANRPPPRTPEILDLKLTEGTPPLKEFLDQKKPGEEHSKRYLAIAYWLKHNLKINEVSTNHIHTGYRHMKWNTPKDAGAPLRKLKNTQQWLSKGSGEGLYAINHIGENIVNDMGGGGGG
jgi:hypothetical protein